MSTTHISSSPTQIQNTSLVDTVALSFSPAGRKAAYGMVLPGAHDGGCTAGRIDCCTTTLVVYSREDRLCTAHSVVYSGGSIVVPRTLVVYSREDRLLYHAHTQWRTPTLPRAIC